MVDKKAASSVPTQDEMDFLYRQITNSPHDSEELQRQLVNYKKEQWVRDQLQGIELPRHTHHWERWHSRVVDASYVDTLERELRDARRELEELKAPQIGPDLLTPMRQMAAKFDLLEKALDGESDSGLGMWDELFKRQGRFYIDEQALKEDPRLVMSVMCGVIPLRCEMDYARAQFDITAVSLYFKPLDKGQMIPFYGLRFVTDTDNMKAVSFEWVQE